MEYTQAKYAMDVALMEYELAMNLSRYLNGFRHGNVAPPFQIIPPPPSQQHNASSSSSSEQLSLFFHRLNSHEVYHDVYVQESIDRLVQAQHDHLFVG